MFFSKKSGFHCLVLYINNKNPHPLHLVMPQEVANDVISTLRKFEKSELNQEKYIGNLGPILLIHDIQGFNKLEIYNDTLPWSEPTLYTDFAKKITDKLQGLFKDDSFEQENVDEENVENDHLENDTEDEAHELEEDLVYFIGEFTMMQDNGFVAPF